MLFRPPAAAIVHFHKVIVTVPRRTVPERTALETEGEQEAPEREGHLDGEAPLALRPRKIERVGVHAAEIVGIGAEFLAQPGYRGFHPVERFDAVPPAGAVWCEPIDR